MKRLDDMLLGIVGVIGRLERRMAARIRARHCRRYGHTNRWTDVDGTLRHNLSCCANCFTSGLFDPEAREIVLDIHRRMAAMTASGSR